MLRSDEHSKLVFVALLLVLTCSLTFSDAQPIRLMCRWAPELCSVLLLHRLLRIVDIRSATVRRHIPSGGLDQVVLYRK